MKLIRFNPEEKKSVNTIAVLKLILGITALVYLLVISRMAWMTLSVDIVMSYFLAAYAFLTGVQRLIKDKVKTLGLFFIMMSFLIIVVSVVVSVNY